MKPEKLKILYAEDNRITAQETTEALRENGYEVQTVYDGNAAWQAFQESTPDLIVLDQQMPGKTGTEVFLLIRRMNPRIPVLILSSFTELCAASLKIGTDDFVRKDGGIEELCARIEAAWRRYSNNSDFPPISNEIYHLSDTSYYYAGNSTLNIGNQSFPLNGMLAELLTILCQNQNQFISKKAICLRIWNNDNPSKVSLLSDYISKLRQILKADPTLEIRSSYGRGFCLKAPK